MMGSDSSSSPLVDTVNNSQNESKKRSCSKEHTQEKAPKRIRKAEREKEKREQLNELFLDLADTLDLSEQNNGKACILREAIRLLKDLVGQIDSLKKDSASLLSETHYVTMEKNEMVEENSALKAQIEKLESEIKARVAQCGPNLMNVGAHMEFPQQENMTKLPVESLQLPTMDPTVQQGHAVFLVPLCNPHGQAALSAHNVAEQTPKATSTITKPQARYPTPMDSWPLQLLSEQPTSN